MIKFPFCFFFTLIFYQLTFSQKKEKLPSYFGFQIKPLITGNFLSKSTITISDSNFTGTFTQKVGYSFGAIARVGLTKLISLETGINQVRRNYRVDFSYPDSSLSGKTSLSIISYDIPLNTMIYIQLSKRIFTNASLGTSFVYYPSNVGSVVTIESEHIFKAEGRRNKRFDFELNGNLGFELRTEKKGFFYVGTSVKLPLAPIFKVAASYTYYQSKTPDKLGIGNINGAYLSFDLRYFFPNIKTKGQQFNVGPIE